jgi:hypothetical protein
VVGTVKVIIFIMMSKIVVLKTEGDWVAYNGFLQDQILSFMPTTGSNINADYNFIGAGAGAYFEVFMTRNKSINGFEPDFDNICLLGDDSTGELLKITKCFNVDISDRMAGGNKVNATQWVFFRLKSVNASTEVHIRIDAESDIIKYRSTVEPINEENA